MFWRVDDWRSLQGYQRNVKPFIAVNSLTLRGKAGFEYAVHQCEKIENSRALDTTAYLSFFELLHNGVCFFRRLSKLFVMQKISTRITPSFSRVLCVRALGYSRVACCRSGCCLFSKGCFRELVRPKRVFDDRFSLPE